MTLVVADLISSRGIEKKTQGSCKGNVSSPGGFIVGGREVDGFGSK